MSDSKRCGDQSMLYPIQPLHAGFSTASELLYHGKGRNNKQRVMEKHKHNYMIHPTKKPKNLNH
jgi:hypothetical protein